MKESKLNCWEYHKCGRETGGLRSQELGVCPAARETRLEGIHNGNRAGRSCWVVSGTLCGGEVQGTFAKKFDDCERCDFYRQVKDEESPYFQLSATLLSIMKTRPSAEHGNPDREEDPLCYNSARRSI